MNGVWSSLPRLLPAVLAVTISVSAGPAAAQTVYHAFGDSITWGIGDAATRPDSEKGYAPRLEDLLQTAGQAATVVNHGVPGEKTPEGLVRIDGVLAGAEPGDVLLLMEGTNDVTQRATISQETTVFNLVEMGRKAEAQGLEVIHSTIIPRPPFARRDNENVNTRQLVGLIRNLAGLTLRDLADPFQVFSAQPTPYALLYSNDPEDRVGHPNAAGYDLLARMWFDVLTGVDSVPPVHGVVRPFHGEDDVAPTVPIVVDVWDFGRGIDLTATGLLVNGLPVPATITGDSKRAELRYQPPLPLSGTVEVRLRASDLATPVNTTGDIVARFTIEGASTNLPGDFDGNGRVDGSDLINFAFHFGAIRGEPNYEVDADLDGDGSIDGEDLAILSANFGKASP